MNDKLIEKIKSLVPDCHTYAVVEVYGLVCDGERAKVKKVVKITLAVAVLAVRRLKFPGAAGHQALLGATMELDILKYWNLSQDDLALQSAETQALLARILGVEDYK